MTLSREKLRDGYFQQLVAQAPDDPDRPPILSDEQIQESLETALAKAPQTDQVWIFGYGSLIWNPLFDVLEQVPVQLTGYQRKFCLKTKLARGCAQNPGLILGLVPGNSCEGLALRMGGSNLRDELFLLWRREMVTGAYEPLWLDLTSDTHSICGLTFVMNRSYSNFVGDLSVSQTAQLISRARGPMGTCAEYLFNTQASLLANQIHDDHMIDLTRRVTNLIAENGEP